MTERTKVDGEIAIVPRAPVPEAHGEAAVSVQENVCPISWSNDDRAPVHLVAPGISRVEESTDQRDEGRVDQHADRELEQGAHAAVAWSGRSLGKSASESLTPRSAASANSDARRQVGMRPLVFQLETVDGVSVSAEATALVPPSRPMMSLTVCITINYGNRNYGASL